MKILILVLYSEQPVYRVMKTLLTNYYFGHSLVKNGLIKVLFYSFGSENKTTETDLTFVGNESLIPGILNKTISAFRSAFPVDEKIFDYCLRSNISTVVNLTQLYDTLINSKEIIHYGGSYVHTIKSLNQNVGVINEKFIGKQFVSGTAILMSFDSMKLLLTNLEKLKEKFGLGIIDDVMIGLWMDELGIKNIKEFSSKVNVDERYSGVLFYRNKRIVSNRANDIMGISRLCSALTLVDTSL